PTASINSLTYLWQAVLTKSPAMIGLANNRYLRIARKGKAPPPVHGFRSWYGWGPDGQLLEAGGQHYFLSTVLAVTSGRGNSVREAISYLTTSATADGTFPKGTIYFSKTEDVRSQTRSPSFASAVTELKELGVRAEVISTPMPTGRKDVQGLTMGLSAYSWQQSHSKILPGALCENFTSFGGAMREQGGQTTLAELLRAGAAGSSGTVIEPFAIWQKFPSPFVQVHYARGCTLAESFYQAVFAPAQLLIVGDPLCRPWANIPKVNVQPVKPGEKVSGTLELRPTATLPKAGKIDRYELFVDGRRSATALAGESLLWDSTAESDGFHEVSVVAIEAGPIESQGRAQLGVVVDNHGRTAQMTTSPANTVRWDETLKVHVKAPGMSEILIVNNDRLLGRVSASEGQVEINPRRFGLGPVMLQAFGVSGSGPRNRVAATPVRITVEPGKPLPPIAETAKNLAHGLLLKLANGKTVPIQDTFNPAWLVGSGVEANQPFSLTGIFDVPTADVYQFELWHLGDLKLAVDSTVLYNGTKGDYSQKFIPLSLAPGRHRLSIVGRTADDPRLRILFGGPGAVSLAGTAFRHAREQK
ncbi:MAG TPA: hypothetical protein VHV08_16530, partial [Pirellulales bacterium]|nr:hypothetical protein [Pirellulales bacterium]